MPALVSTSSDSTERDARGGSGTVPAVARRTARRTCASKVALETAGISTPARWRSTDSFCASSRRRTWRSR
ncbi:hypothetical protein [Brachybacterium sp. GPGPB12]|uniref:hypothetical protein n=1 Tax=Brachybacterium sp. GPGPB12 TaxID=3023517 RepID=UPI003134261F